MQEQRPFIVNLNLTQLCPLLQETDTDLEVVLEKKGNMDEAHIDQVQPRPSSGPSRCLLPPLESHLLPARLAR